VLILRAVGNRPTYLLALSSKDGRVIYDGPVESDDQRKSVPAEVAATLAAGQPIQVSVGGAPVELGAEHLIVNEAPLSGWAVKNSAAETVALDLELTHELRLAGLARDVVRLIQDARKSAGLEVTDRIALWWRVGGSPEPAEAIRAHADQIAGEVLATDMVEGAPDASEAVHEVVDDDLGLHVWLRRAL